MKRIIDINRDEKYDISAFRICPFDVIVKGNYSVLHPKGEEYGFRIGVLDKANNRVVEIDMGCSYDYIETKSYGLVNNAKIECGKRYAYLPVYVSISELTNDDIKKIFAIIKKLEKKEKIVDGNMKYTNEEYLEKLDEIQLQKELDKINEPKKLFKRKKRG